MAGHGVHLAAFIGTAVLVALASTATVGATMLTDTTRRQVELAATPQRIVALTASTVEILFAIRAGPAVVGRGAVTVFPAEAEGSPVINTLEAILRLLRGAGPNPYDPAPG